MPLENEDRSEKSKEGNSDEQQRHLIEDLMPPTGASSDSQGGRPWDHRADQASLRDSEKSSFETLKSVLGDVFRPTEPQIINPTAPMSEGEVFTASREIADRIGRGDKLGNEWGDINKMMQRAAESGQLEDMVRRINDQLRQHGSDKMLFVSSQLQQSVFLPEHSPFDSWNQYTVTVTDQRSRETDSTTFSANHRHHPGTGLDSFPSIRRGGSPRPGGIPNFDIRFN